MKNRSPAEPPSPPPSPPPPVDTMISDPVISQHRANLQSLSAELDNLQRLSDRWRDLAAELAQEEALLESTAAELLSGYADDDAFTSKSDRVAALEARVRAVRKLSAAQGTAMQKRLQVDIPAVEWFCTTWLAYRKSVEMNALLLTVVEARRGALREHALALAEGGIAYCSSADELPPCAPMTWLWQRPIEIQSEKTAVSQRLIADPLYAPPKPEETIAALLAAGRAQESRWKSLLTAIGEDAGFVPPSSYEPPKIESWQPGAEQAGRSLGNPLTPYWTEAELEVVPWEQSKAG